MNVYLFQKTASLNIQEDQRTCLARSFSAWHLNRLLGVVSVGWEGDRVVVFGHDVRRLMEREGKQVGERGMW